MGVITVSHEYKSSVPAPRLFKALNDVKNNLLPKLLPESIKCIEYIQGNGEVGSLVKTTSAKGYVINRIDAFDTSNCYTKFTSIEGSWIGDKIESVVYENKFEASGSACVVKMTYHFHTKGDANVDQEIKSAQEGSVGLIKVIDAHLVSNPAAYA